jgi:hypothetical protein
LVKYADIDANLRRVKYSDMTIVEITGGMLRAARSLTGLSPQELTDRALDLAPVPDRPGRISRLPSLRISLRSSSNSIHRNSIDPQRYGLTYVRVCR